MTVQRADDLVGFDPVTMDLFLAVDAAAEGDLSVREKATQVAGSIHPRAGMGFEESGKKRSAVVAGLLRYPRATLRSADVDFAHLAGRNRMARRHRECGFAHGQSAYRWMAAGRWRQ